jgi:predicted ribosomally synthesized peptide with nif11-like leader
MSEEQLKVFLEIVKADTSLQKKLKGAADVDAVVAITKAQSELSDEELEDVSGGISIIGVCELVCQNKILNRTLTQIP